MTRNTLFGLAIFAISATIFIGVVGSEKETDVKHYKFENVVSVETGKGTIEVISKIGDYMNTDVFNCDGKIEYVADIPDSKDMVLEFDSGKDGKCKNIKLHVFK